MELQTLLKEYYLQKNPPKPVHVFLSNEEIKAFFDTVVVPFLQDIEESVKPHVERVHISQFVKICKIRIKEPEGTFTFKIEVGLYGYPHIQVYPQYEAYYGSRGMGGGSFDREVGKEFPLDLKAVTLEELTELFYKAFLKKDGEYKRIKAEIKRDVEDGTWPV